jgi:hypothetical protein
MPSFVSVLDIADERHGFLLNDRLFINIYPLQAAFAVNSPRPG